MRLLVIGHSYAVPFAQSKYVAMTRLDPDLTLRLVVPQRTYHPFTTNRHGRHPALDPASLIVVPASFNGSHMTQFFAPVRLARLLQTFDPDHIHIEEDPHSIIGCETTMLARVLARRATISFFIWDNLARAPRFPMNLAKTFMTRQSLQRCSLVICGNTEAQDLLRRIKRWHGPSVVLPQLGLEVDEYDTAVRSDVRRNAQWTPEVPLVGFVGRIVAEKGVLVLLDALSRLSHLNWRLLLVGDGPLKDDIERQWRPALGDRLVLLSAVPHRDVSQYLRCLEVFVLPSYGIPTWKEQFGLTLAQAMMAGVACVASASGSIPEVLGATGLIVREGDAGDLASALERVLQSVDLRRRLGLAGRARAEERYSAPTVAAAYLSTFSDLSARLGRPV